MSIENINKVRSLLQTKTHREVVEEFPRLRNALLYVMRETDTLLSVKEKIAAWGIKLSRERIRQLTSDLAFARETRQQKAYEQEESVLKLFDEGKSISAISLEVGYSIYVVTLIIRKTSRAIQGRKKTRKPIAPLSEDAISKSADVIRLFDEGKKIKEIVLAVGLYRPVVARILSENNRSAQHRSIAAKGFSVGDRVGNWEIVRLDNATNCLCRDIRNNVERFVPYISLTLGLSTGSVEGKKHLPPSHRSSTDEVEAKKAQVLDLFDEGRSIASISRDVGLCQQTCKRIVKEGKNNV